MIGAIVLGAGSSRRFGDDKRKARLPDGRRVIEQTTANALAAFEAVLLVLRADDQAFRAQLADSLGSEHLRVFLAPDSALGMGHSLANAVTAVSHWQGAFICLGDMPYLTQATLRQLQTVMAERTGPRIVVPTHGGEWAHPVGFSADYFGSLQTITGDRGARHLIKANQDDVVEIAFNDPGVIQDIDVPQDLR
ncbi:MAG: nucleotidyltransferase family protein [Gammaproteobacteria bacterium]